MLGCPVSECPVSRLGTTNHSQFFCDLLVKRSLFLTVLRYEFFKNIKLAKKKKKKKKTADEK